jgi:hypothetical protein
VCSRAANAYVIVFRLHNGPGYVDQPANIRRRRSPAQNQRIKQQ